MIHALLLSFILPNGKLVIQDMKVGTGPSIANGDTPEYVYRGALLDGKLYFNQYGQTPSVYPVGKVRSDNWLNEALLGMRAGGERKVIVPPQYRAYEEYGMPTAGHTVVVPKDSTTVGYVKVLAVHKATDKPLIHITEIKGGSGKPVKRGDRVHFFYTEMFLNGKEIDSSYMRIKRHAVKTPAGYVPVDGPPLKMIFTVGKCEITPALDKTALGMKVGGLRKVAISWPLYEGMKPYAEKDGPPAEDINGRTIVFALELRNIE